MREGVGDWELVRSVSLATNCSGFGSLLPKIDFGNEHKLLSQTEMETETESETV